MSGPRLPGNRPVAGFSTAVTVDLRQAPPPGGGCGSSPHGQSGRVTMYSVGRLGSAGLHTSGAFVTLPAGKPTGRITPGGNPMVLQAVRSTVPFGVGNPPVTSSRDALSLRMSSRNERTEMWPPFGVLPLVAPFASIAPLLSVTSSLAWTVTVPPSAPPERAFAWIASPLATTSLLIDLTVTMPPTSPVPPEPPRPLACTAAVAELKM